MMFNCCPRCGADALEFDAPKRWRCRLCEFTYFHNVAAAVGVLLLHEGRLLLTVRAEAPGAGALDLPGGFVDPQESVERAAEREVTEELGLAPPGLTYLGSAANRYRYAGVDYVSSDVFFVSQLQRLPSMTLDGEVAGVQWRRPRMINDNELAFDSVRAAVHMLRERFDREAYAQPNSMLSSSSFA